MTIVAVPAAGACVAAGGGEGTYTIRGGACRFGQPPMNNAKLHHKHGRVLNVISLEILSFPYQPLSSALCGQLIALTVGGSSKVKGLGLVRMPVRADGCY